MLTVIGVFSCLLKLQDVQCFTKTRLRVKLFLFVASHIIVMTFVAFVGVVECSVLSE